MPYSYKRNNYFYYSHTSNPFILSSSHPLASHPLCLSHARIGVSVGRLLCLPASALAYVLWQKHTFAVGVRKSMSGGHHGFLQSSIAIPSHNISSSCSRTKFRRKDCNAREPPFRAALSSLPLSLGEGWGEVITLASGVA